MADNEEIDVKEYYSDTIKSLVPINELSPGLQNEIIKLASINEYKKKEFVFKQGDRDEYAFYLLEGEIDMVADNHVHSTLASGADSARYAMARLQPRQFSARAASKKVTILQLDRGALDRLMVAAPQGDSAAGGEMEVAEIEVEDSGDWMTRMLQSELFCRLPTANIHQLFALLEPVELKAGDQVIQQGDVGEYYYIIQEGRCEVSRTPASGAKSVKLAELHAGDSFGEEALLTEAKRNATVSMLTDGVLMQLSKENFINLIKKPTLEAVSFSEGRQKVAAGAVWLDVRFQNEHERAFIEDSVNIPLNMLRLQIDKLDQQKPYVIYCDTGGRSSAAAFLLTDRGYKVCYLQQGLSAVADSELQHAAGEPSEPGSKPAASAPEPAKAPVKLKPAAPEPAPVEAEEEDKTLDSEVRSSVIDTNLARTNFDLEQANKKLQESDERKSQELLAAKKKLEAEKKRLESEKKAIEKEAQKLRQKEEEKLKKMKAEAEKRLTAEKNKLEEIYNRNAMEMEKLQREKEAAEEQLKKEKEKFERDTAEARRKMEEEAEKRKSQQESMERAIQIKAKAKLEAEKRKMAEEFARTSEELDKARKGQLMAEAARKAAQDEAKNIIEEYKKQFEEQQASEKARLESERLKLEEESQRIQETYREIQRAKDEAEKARVEAEKEVAALKAKQKADVTSPERKTMDEQIKVVEERLQQAEKNVKDAESAGESIKEAREINEQELLRQQQIEAEMRAQVEADLQEFMQQQNAENPGKTESVANADHIKRIRERAMAAKHEAEKATDDLFADIAAQLGKDE